jgi:hypothetical protein
MAWIDDRIWCHPKFTDLSPAAAWVWVKAVAYSTGFATKGHLTTGQQRTVGSDKRIRRELVAAGVWDEAADGGVTIHDWDDHNSKRDDRREKERVRLRAYRERTRTERSTERETVRSTDAVRTRVDGSDGSEGSSKAFARANLGGVPEPEQPREFAIPAILVKEI